jgi:predicted aconitase
VGNTAEPGTPVTWAESSAVNFGNSVLGLRVNRMATGMEILCGIAGKVPVFGVLTDEGRRAKWHIEVKLSGEPHWGVLGGAIGMKVVEKIPYISGVDQWLGMQNGKPDSVAVGKLKAMGSATASNGAVGLYHVENVTPEAIEQGRGLLTEDHQTYVIDDAELARIRDGYPNLWKDPNGDPTRIYIGCPHNTYDELVYWGKKLHQALQDAGQEELAIPVVMAQSVAVRDHFMDEHPVLFRDLRRAGVLYTNICTPAFQGLKGMMDIERGVTNSNKGRCYTNMRLYDDDDLVQIALTGKVPE